MVTIQELQKMVYAAKEEEKQKRKILVEKQLEDMYNRIMENAKRGENVMAVSWLLYKEVVFSLTEAGFLVEEDAVKSLMGSRMTKISFPLEEQ